MPRIIPCSEHKGLWEGIDAIPDRQWNMQKGHGVVASATINGVVERLDCPVCKWAPNARVERALGTVGDPTARPPVTKMSKERRRLVAEKKITKQTRDRRPTETRTLNLGGVTVTLTIRASLKDMLALSQEQTTVLQKLLQYAEMRKE